jgi:hypothetical protein
MRIEIRENKQEDMDNEEMNTLHLYLPLITNITAAKEIWSIDVSKPSSTQFRHHYFVVMLLVSPIAPVSILLSAEYQNHGFEMHRRAKCSPTLSH